MCLYIKKASIILFLFYSSISYASGGYDNGTPAGKRNLDIDLTINPFDYIPYGQSYIVWGYGLTNRIDFQGYVTHEAAGVNHLYAGFMYNFMNNKYLDLSTAFGLRFRNCTVHSFFPQLLYTIKLPKGFDVIGSMVLVCYTQENYNEITRFNVRDNYQAKVTYDIALRAPIPIKKLPSYINGIKFAVGAFRGISGRWYPTYSIDFRFKLSKSV